MNTLTQAKLAEILLQVAKEHHAFVQTLSDEKKQDEENARWHEWYAERLILTHHIECSTIPIQTNFEKEFDIHEEAKDLEFYGFDPNKKFINEI